MDDPSGVIDFFLESAVGVGKCFSARAEPEVGTEVVSALVAVLAVSAHDTGLDDDALADGKVSNAWADRCYNACRFMAEDKGSFDRKVCIASMKIIVDCVKLVNNVDHES
jgi:hypothetical protein